MSNTDSEQHKEKKGTSWFNKNFIIFVIFIFICLFSYQFLKLKINKKVEVTASRIDSLIKDYDTSYINFSEFCLSDDISGYKNIDVLDDKFRELKNKFLLSAYQLQLHIQKENYETFGSCNNDLINFISFYYEYQKALRLDYSEEDLIELIENYEKTSSDLSEISNYKNSNNFNILLKEEITKKRELVFLILKDFYQ